MQQGVLISGIRNCDGVISEGPYKILIRGLRALCIKSAQTKGSFNARRPNLQRLLAAADDFVDKHLDHMPMHFAFHLMHAAEVIGYEHPDHSISAVWLKIYKMIVHSMHLNVEKIDQFKRRLADNPEQVKREEEHDLRCYDSKNYGDGTGTINEN